MYTKSHFAPTADRSRLSGIRIKLSSGFEQWVLREAISDRAPFQKRDTPFVLHFLHSMTCSHGHTVPNPV